MAGLHLLLTGALCTGPPATATGRAWAEPPAARGHTLVCIYMLSCAKIKNNGRKENCVLPVHKLKFNLF